MSVRGILPYLAVSAALAGYLFFRIQTAKMAPRRPSDDIRGHERGRARRRLRISRTWESLGHRDKKDTP